MIPEMLGVYLVHRSERPHVGKIHRRLYDLIQRKPRLFKHGSQIPHDSIGLLGDPSVDELPGGGVDRNLAGGEDPLPCDNGLGVRADGLRGLGGMNELKVIHSIITYKSNFYI